MTTPTEPPVPPGRPAAARPGRKLGPVADNVGSAHRAWLDPMRTAYLASGLTLNELSGRACFAKSKISELLRGVGLYPRWEIILLLALELGMPNWPLYRLWSQAALESHKSSEWINGCTDRTTVTATHTTPPLDHGAFRELVENDYALYAQVFLDDDQRDNAVDDTFDRLWLSWNEALAHHDTRRYAWNVCEPPLWPEPPTAMAGRNLAARLSTPSSCRTSPIRPTTRTSSPKPSNSSPRSAACPTASSTSSCCVGCAASLTRPPPPSWAHPWPPSAPTNAMPPASWTASSPRPAPKGPPREPHRRTPLQSPPRP